MKRLRPERALEMSFRVFCLFVGFAGYALVARPHLPAADDPIFIESAAATGLAFTHVNGATGNYYLPEMMGAGVALFDYDNDGDLDVFLVQGGALPGPEREAPTSRLFRNDLFVPAHGRFTAAANQQCNGPVGTRDDCSPRVYRPVPARLFRNDGRGHFVDVTAAAGISKAYGAGLGVAVGDYNGDGWLDAYVA